MHSCIQVLERDDGASLSAVGAPRAECALSAAGSAAGRGAWSPCGSNPSYTNLEDGAYTFMARAPSTSSIIAHQYAVSNFTVDTSAPAMMVRVIQGAHSYTLRTIYAESYFIMMHACSTTASAIRLLHYTPKNCQRGPDACIVRKMECKC